jgi:hypothetical protein
MGHKAHLPELRRALLRSDARSGGLPEMQHAVRSRGFSQGAPVEKELEPVGADDIDADLETEQVDAAEEDEEEEEGVPLEDAEEEDEELIEDASELGEDEDDMAEVIDNVEDEEH